MGKGKPKGRPELVRAGDEIYKLTALKTISSKPNGVPCELQLIEDSETVDIEGGEHFMTAYVPRHMLRDRKS